MYCTGKTASSYCNRALNTHICIEHIFDELYGSIYSTKYHFSLSLQKRYTNSACHSISALSRYLRVWRFLNTWYTVWDSLILSYKALLYLSYNTPQTSCIHCKTSVSCWSPIFSWYVKITVFYNLCKRLKYELIKHHNSSSPMSSTMLSLETPELIETSLNRTSPNDMEFLLTNPAGWLRAWLVITCTLQYGK